MKLARFNDHRLGLLQGDVLTDVTAALAHLPSARYPFPRHDIFIEHLPFLRPFIQECAQSGQTHALQDVSLLSPVANVGKVVAAPVNYQRHMEEVLAQRDIHHGNLIHEIHKAGLFLKASSSVIGAGHAIELVHTDRRNDHEVELAVVIGKAGRGIQLQEALSHVAGYCIGLDITLRGPEERSLRKSPDTYTVLGPYLVTADELGDPGALDLSLHVGDELRQQANTRELILGVAELIVFASSFYTLHPGDVLITGTPQGVGPIVAGDTLHARIQGIGAMSVRVAAAA